MSGLAFGRVKVGSRMMVDKKSAPKSVSQGQKPLLRVRFDSERWVCVDPDAVDGASTTDSL